MTQEEIQINEALLDVRKAYRLLNAYQARVLDIVKYVTKQMNISLLSAWPWYTNTEIKGTKVDLDNWSIDWLPMYLYEFNLFNNAVDVTLCKFSVIIVSDTGFFDSNMVWEDRNRDKRFNSLESSSSQIVFIAGENKWHNGGASLMGMFKKNAQPKIDKDEIGDGVFVRKSYPLSEFFSAASIDMVIKDFINFSVANNMRFLKQLSPFELGSEDSIN